MAGVIGSPTVTGRLSAAADKAGDGARTQVAQFGESAQQIVLLLLQLRQGRWYGGTPSLNVLYMFRPQLQKRKHPPLHFHVAHPFALSQGGPAGNQRPCPAACPHAQERGIFRGGPVARWPFRIPSGRGQVQWNKLLPLSS